MTEAERAEWYYQHRDELVSEDDEPVEVEVSPRLDVTLSFRLPAAEADEIRSAARAAGVSLSAWIREACAMSYVTPDDALGSEPLSEASSVRRELEEFEERLAEAHDAFGQLIDTWRRVHRRSESTFGGHLRLFQSFASMPAPLLITVEQSPFSPTDYRAVGAVVHHEVHKSRSDALAAAEDRARSDALAAAEDRAGHGQR